MASKKDFTTSLGSPAAMFMSKDTLAKGSAAEHAEEVPEPVAEREEPSAPRSAATHKKAAKVETGTDLWDAIGSAEANSETRSRRVALQWKPSMHDKVLEMATANGMSLNRYIERVMEILIEADEAKRK